MNSFKRRYRNTPETNKKPLNITGRAVEILTLAKIDPYTVKGTGSGGRITAKDAKKAVSNQETTSREEEE